MQSGTMFIVSEFMEEKITALSTFFRTTAMSSKATKKSTANIKTANLFVKKGTTKAPEKKSKKKVVSSSESESSSEESSSEEEPPKKSKKKVEKKKGRKIVSSSESSSEDEDEIVVEQVPKKESIAVPLDGIAKLGEGLIAIATQFAESNALNARIMEKLIDVFAKMEAREQKEEAGDNLLAVVEDVVKRGGSITIGSGPGANASYHFKSVEHLRGSMGTLATQEDFSKVIDELQDDEVVEDDDLIAHA
jgi:hypothetical protein